MSNQNNKIMNFISGNKVGTTVNVMINGKLHSKDCGIDSGAQLFFDAVLKAKADPSDENIEKLYEFLNKNIRIAKAGGFEFDIENQVTYLKGFDTPVPEDVLETIEDYIENGYPLTSITNFWKLLMANPDKRVREDLYKFIKTHDFSITDEGYMVVYKTVDFLRKVEKDLASFASNAYLKIKDKWKESPRNYSIYEKWVTETQMVEEEVCIEEGWDEAEDEGMDYDEFYEEYGREPEYSEGEYEIQEVEREVRSFTYEFTKQETLDKWLLDESKDVVYVNNVQTIMDTLAEIEEENRSVYTDKYTHKMEIKLGVPVQMDRTECDADPQRDCSYGLHVGATKYVESFRGAYRRNSDEHESPVLVCLVNPMHVVAVPEYDHSKMRVAEYYPFARGLVRDGKIDIVESKYFPSDYKVHEEAELTEMLRKNVEELRPTAINAEVDEREVDEYLKVLESRVVDLTAE
jgi:hypothetical protein